MWELDCEEGWELKNWCFWTVMLEKTLESPLDCKEIQPVDSTGDQSWVFFGRDDTKAETPVLWPPYVKSWLTGKDSCWEGLGAGGKGMTEDEMAGWYHWLDGREFEWTPGVMMDREAWHAAIHGVTKSWTWLSDWTELNWRFNITRWTTSKSNWLYSLQPKMEKLYTVSKNKTGSWLWLRSRTPYCQIQTQIEESRENH